MRILFLVAALCAAPILHAAPVRYQTLAHSPRWLALLHWNTGATWRDVGASYADDADFFLAPNGKHDAVAELRATVRALKPPHSKARCRFPARYRFIAEHLGWHETKPLAHCRQYRKWRKKMPLGQLVLVFPAAYLNSPSSMFGHTLLRLDPKPDPETVWLSQAINFGAQADPNEGSILYIWRGLVGGYPGQFSIVPYVDKIQEYSHLENRDLWEYALNLNKDELDWVVRHLWELRNINFDYFFFDENCSFRLLELIRVGRPTAPLLQHYRFAELPVNTVRALYAAHLVTKRHYRPSKARELTHLVDQLDGNELALSKALRGDAKTAASPRFKTQPPARRNLMADTAYQALRLQYRSQPRTEKVAHDSLALLQVVQANPAPDIPPLTPPPAPETGHDTQAWTLGAGQRNGRNFLDLGYRLTYHGMLDPVTGFLPGAAIQGLNIQARVTESQGLDLERLDVVNIRSLAPRGPFVKPISWFVHGGLEQTGGEDRDLALFLQGGPGLSWRLGDITPYALAVGRLEHIFTVDPVFRTGGGAEVGLLYDQPALQVGLRLRGLYFQDGHFRRRASLTADLPVSRDNAIRAECAHSNWRNGDSNSCRLAWRHFFN